MYKIFLTVRNRLAITKKCIKSLYLHSKLPFQLYVYDNSTNYLLDEHFEYFKNLYKEGKISQITFTSNDSTFNAFSKASVCNFFGLQHEQDPNKGNYDFLLILDNDMLLTPGFDEILLRAWKDVNRLKMNNIKIISQDPAGIMHREGINDKIAGFNAIVGKCGGSGFWAVQKNFFEKIGLLDLRGLVNQNKQHDVSYWRKLNSSTGGKPYILGLRTKLSYHAGKYCGSICNLLTKKPPKERLEAIKCGEAEDLIESMSFDEFYKMLKEDIVLSKKW